MYTKTTWVNRTAPYLEALNLNHMEKGIFDNSNTIDAIGLGETSKGEWTPTVGTEYPSTPTLGDSYFIAGLSSPYTFAGGDLTGRETDNQDKIYYSDTGWILVEQRNIPTDIAKYVDTIADLSGVDINTYTVAIVKEAIRGGTFIYDDSQSGTNNGGTIFNGWVRQYDGSVNILWFGAITGDDTKRTINDDAIIAAMGISNSTYIPKGHYYISKSIGLDIGHTLYGDGKSSFLDMNTDDAGGVIHISGTYLGYPVTDCIVHSLGLDCNLVPNLNGIGMGNCERNIVKNIWVYNAGRKAFTMQDNVHNNIITDCYADGGEDTRSIISLEGEGTSGGLVTCSNNTVSNITIGVATDKIIDLLNTENNIISNITSKSSGRGIKIQNSHNDIIRDIQINSNNQTIDIVGSSNSKFFNVVNIGNPEQVAVKFLSYMSDGIEFYSCDFTSKTGESVDLNHFSTQSRFVDCKIITDTQDSLISSALSVDNEFTRCIINSVGNRGVYCIGKVSFNSCKINGGGIQVTDGDIRVINCDFTGIGASNTIYNSGSSIFSYVEGNTTDGTATFPPLGSSFTSANNSWDGVILYNSSVPSSGTWRVKDKCYATTPTAGEYIGWICVTAGTPGTWKGFGQIES